jgi:hypothetical protein
VTYHGAPSVIPEMVYGVSRDLDTPQTDTSAFGCVECLQAGPEASQGPVYLISGTSLCATHAKRLLEAAR